MLYLVVIRLWSASRAAYTFVLIPLVTVLLSAWIDDEPIRAGLVVGGLLVLAGVYIGALRPGREPSAADASGRAQRRVARDLDRGGLFFAQVTDPGRCDDDLAFPREQIVGQGDLPDTSISVVSSSPPSAISRRPETRQAWPSPAWS